MRYSQAQRQWRSPPRCRYRSNFNRRATPAGSAKTLLEAVIRLIADAIDAEIAHTGAHCQRVPVLTGCLPTQPATPTAGRSAISGDAEQREALHLAAAA